MRVLVVDPDERFGQAACAALGLAGLEASWVTSAVDALDRISDLAPGVVVIDVAAAAPAGAEQRDGAWLARHVRKLAAAPRLVFTAGTDPDPQRMAGLSAAALVLKPTTSATLLSAVTGPAEEAGVRLAEEDWCGLLEATLLSSDLGEALGGLARRLGATLGVVECILVGTTGDRQIAAGSRGPVVEDPSSPLWRRFRTALVVGGPVFEAHDDRVESFLAIPVGDASRLGAILVRDEGAHPPAASTVRLLEALAARLRVELAWRLGQERLALDWQRLRETSMIDPVIDLLWSRFALDQTLGREISCSLRRKESLTVAIVDVRGLRQVNERHGHHAGDALLRHAAAQVRGMLRAHDIVARHAGSSIAAVLPAASIDGALAIVARIREALAAATVDVDGAVLGVDVAVGLAQTGDPTETAELLLARAAAALREAKQRHEPVGVADATPAAAGAAEIDVEIADVLGIVPGATVGGSYRVLHEISSGAFGVVYRAEDLSLGRQVALKVLRPDLARDPAVADQFRREAKILAALRHDNLIQVHALGMEGDQLYFVMELVEGEEAQKRLDDARKEGRHLAFAEVARVVTQVAGALDAMHAAGAIHRDVKPENVLHDRVRDRVVLVDVGIARRRGGPNFAAGTPGYSAPESFASEEVGPAADVYGLAATTYTLLTGEPPYAGDDAGQVIARQRTEPPIPPSRLRPELPASVDTILLRALASDPAQRFARPSELARALAEALAAPGESPGEAAPLVVTEPAASPDRTGRFVVAEAAPRPRRAPTTLLGQEASEAAQAAPALTRGVLFRAARRALRGRDVAWLAEVTREDPEIGQVLGPAGHALDWYPTAALVRLLRAPLADGRGPFARELGRAAAMATFARFLGADPSALAVPDVLSTVGSFWGEYHSWGEADAEPGPAEAAPWTIVVRGGPAEELLCACTAGLLEGVVTTTGARQVRVDERACRGQGARGCAFAVQWGSAWG